MLIREPGNYFKVEEVHSARAGCNFNENDNGFYVTCNIGEMSVNFLIDCGATSSLISDNVISKLGSKGSSRLQPTDSVLKTVNGDFMSVAGRVDLALEIGRSKFDIPFVVCGIEADGILGQDFLKQHVDSINYKRSCLVLGQNIVPLWTGGQANQVCRIEISDTVKIPSRCRRSVTVNIPQKEHLSEFGYVEPCIELMAKSCICVIGGVVNTTKDTIALHILNYGDEETTVYKNTNLGTCESYFERDSARERVAAVQELSDVAVSENRESADDTILPDHLIGLFDRSSANLSETEKRGLRKLLIKYAGVFSKNSEDIGKTNVVEHAINTGTAAPIRQPPRRLPLGKREIERTEVQKMLERGVIEPSSSAWSSPVVLVTKRDGTPRFCLDYRKLNDVTIKDAYPLPRVDDCIDALAGAKYFSSLDLNSGFWQVAMKPEDKEKTAFSTTLGLYQFNVMSFGLANAPSTFERLMENVLRGLQWIECLLYMDDIIVPCTTVEEGLVRLEHVFQRLQNACLKCKPSKCVFFQKQVKFLGHLVSEEGVATDPEKISAVKSWPIPRNAKEVKSFLGLCSYYRRFVKSFAKIARPLHKVAEKGNVFDWTDDCSEAFNQLKECLVSAPILGYPLENCQFILDTDASDQATGAVLSQIQDDREVVIAYFSKTMNIHEQQYCVTRKELLAVVQALKAFNHYLYGQHILLRTDNAAVSWMRNLKQPSGQVARWLEVLGTYNMTVTHRAGLQHRNADAMSRKPCTQCLRQENASCDDTNHHCHGSSELNTNTGLNGRSESARVVTRSQTQQVPPKPTMAVSPEWSFKNISLEQQQDPALNVIIQALPKSSRPSWQQVSGLTSIAKTLWRMWDRLFLENNVLYRTWFNDEHNSVKQIVVPQQRRDDVLNHFHDIPSSAHLGADKTLDKVRQSFYWPAMKKDIERYCTTCDACSSRKRPKPVKAPLGEVKVYEALERCAIDIYGPLPITTSNNKYILVICDCFTRWTEAIALPNQEAETVTKAFVDEYVSRFGVPLQIHSDLGSNFTSKLFSDMCDLLQLHHTRSTPQHPQANGIVERFNRTLGAMLTMYCEENQRNWDEFLPQVMMAYRSSTHASTGETPNRMVFGKDITLPLQAIIGSPPSTNTHLETSSFPNYVSSLNRSLEHLHEIACKTLKTKALYRKRHYDLYAKKRSFRVGNGVWLHDSTKRPGICSKLAPQWQGPYLVTKKIDDLVYLIKKSAKAPAKPVHVDRLRLYEGSHAPVWFNGVLLKLRD